MRACRWLLFLFILAGLPSLLLAADEPNAAGFWRWNFTTPSGEAMNGSVALKQEAGVLSGLYRGRTVDTDIREGKISAEGDVSFKVVRERDGELFTWLYSGKLSGDTIKGKVEMDLAGLRRVHDWEAKRDPAPRGISGRWKWTFNHDGQELEFLLRLRQQGDKLTGYSVLNEKEAPIQDGLVDGKNFSFTVVREWEGQKIASKYKGWWDGEFLKGKIEAEVNGQTISHDWQAKRVR